MRAWCDRKCLHTLRAILPAWPMASGLTDNWGELLKAMQNVRAFAEKLQQREKPLIDECTLTIDSIIHRSRRYD